MPNRRGTIDPSTSIETANPWGPERFDEAEPQSARGAVGSRDLGEPIRPREHHTADEWAGVDPLPPIDADMPMMKPGDQGG